MSDSTYSVSPSFYRQLIALQLSPKKMHEELAIASVSVGWALAWESLSWGLHPDRTYAQAHFSVSWG